MKHARRAPIVLGFGVFAIGLVLMLLFSWVTSNVPCGIGTTSCSAVQYLTFTPETFIGIVVAVIGLVLVGLGWAGDPSTDLSLEEHLNSSNQPNPDG